jgi:uncharacterized protein
MMATTRTAPTASRPRATLSNEQARALALRAQGFGDETLREPFDILERLGAIQLDSVNVLARSHEIVPFGRVGPYPLAAMHQAIYRERRAFEYWGHAASWLPMAEYRYFIPRMEAIRTWARANWTFEQESKYAHLFPVILDRIRAEGPLTSTAFEDSRAKRGTWWDWKPAKTALEILFARGELMATDRINGFARLYDLPERVLPPGLDVSNPGPAEANRHLLRRTVAALGVATGPEAADYFRLRITHWQPAGTSWKKALAELVEAGEVVEVAVEGWPLPALTTPAALRGPFDLPEHRPTFLTPFDNLVWVRDRVERLFDYQYRLEIYVPGPKRVHGYYVLPLLARGALAGRADVKLDRPTSTLLVRGLWLEGAAPEDAASALRDLATHLGARSIHLDRVEPSSELPGIRSLVD